MAGEAGGEGVEDIGAGFREAFMRRVLDMGPDDTLLGVLHDVDPVVAKHYGDELTARALNEARTAAGSYALNLAASSLGPLGVGQVRPTLQPPQHEQGP